MQKQFAITILILEITKFVKGMNNIPVFTNHECTVYVQLMGTQSSLPESTIYLTEVSELYNPIVLFGPTPPRYKTKNKFICNLYITFPRDSDDALRIIDQSGLWFSDRAFFIMQMGLFGFIDIKRQCRNEWGIHVFIIWYVQNRPNFNQWIINCYSCDKFPGQSFGGLMPSNLQQVDDMYVFYNKIGSKRYARLWGRDPNNDNFAKCERTLEGCDSYDTALGYLKYVFNITIERQHDHYDNTASLLMCSDCGRSLNGPGYSHVVHAFEQIVYLYCVLDKILETPTWKVIWSPFEISTWAGLLATLLSIPVLFKKPIYFMEGIQMLLQQALKEGNKWPIFLSFSAFFISIFSSCYQGIVTRSLTAPLKVRQIETIKEMFERGFKISVNRDEDRNNSARNDESLFAIFGVKTTPNMYFVPNVNGLFEQLTEYPGKATAFIGSMASPYYKLDAMNRDKRLTCDIVKQPIFYVWDTFRFRGSWATQALKVMELAKANGIYGLWEKVYRFRNLKRFLKNVPTKEIVKSLTIISNVSIVFQLLAYMLAASLVAFLIEIIFWKITSTKIKDF